MLIIKLVYYSINLVFVCNLCNLRPLCHLNSAWEDQQCVGLSERCVMSFWEVLHPDFGKFPAVKMNGLPLASSVS